MNFLRKAKPGKGSRVYADAAASTPLSSAAKAEMLRLLDLYGNAGGLHKEAQQAKAEIESARTKIATAIGAHEYELFFTASGTEANNLAIAGILRPLLQKHGKVQAITSAIEHSSILEPLFALESEGLDLTILPVSSEGLVDPKELAEAIKENTVFISIQMVNSEVGTIEPIREFAKEIRKIKKERISDFPLYFHTDASQAPLWLDLKVEKLGIDLLTLDAQKILGPKGVGALYARRGTDIEPLIYGGGQESGLRSGTPNTPLVGAFAVALEEAQKNVEANAKNITEVREYCFAEMQKFLPNIILNGPAFENRAANNLNMSVPGLDAQMAVIALDVQHVAASTRSACDVGDEEPSHVLQALGIAKDLAGTAIRFTFLPSATKAEAKYIAEALLKVAQKYKNE